MSLNRKMLDDTLILSDDSGQILSVRETEQDDRIRIILEGSLKSETAHDFEDELTAFAVLGMDLLVDFEKVTYLSSACTRVLLQIQQKIDGTGKGSLILKNLPDPIRDEMEKTGVLELLLTE